MAPASSKPITLSLLGKLSLLFKLLVIAPPQLLLNNLRCHTLALARGASLKYYTLCAFNKFALRHLTPLQLQYMLPPTVALYKSWIRRQSLPAIKRLSTTSNTTPSPSDLVLSDLKVDIEPLPSAPQPSSLLWLGDRTKATKVVLFFHGGGYAVPMLPGHFHWCFQSYLLSSPGEVAVAILQYTLVPHGQYPTQLKQAAAGLAHILSSGVKPENIIFGGDSAGGNLTCSLLSHLLHPHPEAIPISVAQPIGGAFLVSPWVSARTESASFRRNGGIDMLSSRTINSACGHLLPRDLKDEQRGWVIPVDLPQEEQEGWFRGLDRVVKKVYITAGEQEVFLDQSIQLAEVFKKVNEKLEVRVEIVKSEAHDWILLEGERKDDGDATRRMRAWVKGVWGFK
ncbi:Alpha/Beta hydrolase protein [Apiosordaria backusii]|uniref:Alpha/Beta hydrolase protein n=1 Tax=Apiosordaria backusii TaxID=314023 RepID=A0AA40DYM2_9PEZI|nr:Alpha/Beta hydrolase protein [Apiosordaria backusii]